MLIILLSTIAVSGFAHVRNYSNHTKRLNYTALALQRHVDIEKRSSGGSIKYSYLNSYDWPNLYDGCKSPPIDGYQSPIDINEFDVTLHTIVPHQLHWKDHITNLTMKFSVEQIGPSPTLRLLFCQLGLMHNNLLIKNKFQFQSIFNIVDSDSDRFRSTDFSMWRWAS